MFTIYISRGHFSSKRIDVLTDEQHFSDNMHELSHTKMQRKAQDRTRLPRNALVEYRDR
jgi:hypothetical protein